MCRTDLFHHSPLYFFGQFHRHFLKSPWKFREQKELLLNLRYCLRSQRIRSRWLEEKGLGQRILKSGPSSCCMPSRERMLPQPLEQQQKKPCPELHPLLLKEGPEMNRMGLQLMQNPGQLQSPL